MPSYVIKDPDGNEWEINGPPNATQAQVVEAITKSDDYKAFKAPKKAAPKAAPTEAPYLTGTDADAFSSLPPASSTYNIPKSVFDGASTQAPPRRPGPPITQQEEKKLTDEYNTASPGQIPALEGQPGYRGQVYRDLGQGYKAATPATTLTLGQRRQDRAARLAEGGADLAASDAMANIGLDIDRVGKMEETKFDMDRFDAFRKDPLLNNSVARGVAKGAEGIKQGYLGLVEATADLTGMDTVGKGARSLGNDSERRIAEVGSAEGPARNLEGAIASITTQLPIIIGSAVTGTAGTALAGMMLQSFGSEYLKGKQAKLDPMEAATRASIFSAFEGIGERFALSKFFKPAMRIFQDVPTKDLSQALASYVLRDVPGEQLTTLGQFLTDKAPAIGLGQNATFYDYLTQASDTFFQTVLQGGMMGAGGRGAIAARDAIDSPARQFSRALNETVEKGSFDPRTADVSARELLQSIPDSRSIDPRLTSTPRVENGFTGPPQTAVGPDGLPVLSDVTTAPQEAPVGVPTLYPEPGSTPPVQKQPYSPPQTEDPMARGPDYENSFGMETPADASAQAGYEDSFGTRERPAAQQLDGYDESSAAPAAETPPVVALRATATAPEVRRAIADKAPVETLPPERRAQAGKEVSPQQVKDQNLLVRNLVAAGYQETSPGKWKHPDTIGTTPQSAVTAAAKEQISTQLELDFPDDEVTSGNAVSEDFYTYDKDVDALDRLWGKTGSIYVPWHTGPDILDPHKIDVKSVFQLYPHHFEKYGMTPQGITKGLLNYVPWLNGVVGPPTVSWDDFVRRYGPQFIKNGYDAITFKDKVEIYLVPFVPSAVSVIPKTTAKSIEAQKVHEHARQLRRALWTQTEPEYTLQRVSNDLIRLQKMLESAPYGLTALDVLTFIQENGPSKAYRSLAKQLTMALRNQEEAGLGTTVSIKYTNNKDGVSGTYQLRGEMGEIELVLTNNGMSYRTLVHELIHAVTIPALAVMRQYMKDVDNFDENGNPLQSELVARYKDLKKKSAEFYAYVQRNLAALDLDTEDEGFNGFVRNIKYHGSAYTDNVHEVLAYALTDKAFQELLHSIPVNNDNGLFHTTEMVREFHGIEDDMSSLFYEAVKLFNEFATFPIHEIGGQGATFYALRQRSAPYAAIQIRGPPEINAAIGEYLSQHSETQIMQGGHMSRPYEDGHNKLVAANTYGNIKKADIFPVRSGVAAHAFLQGSPPQPGPMAEAPMYVMGIPAKTFAGMEIKKKGVEIKGVHYFLVNNVNNPAFQDAMGRYGADKTMTVNEAVFLLKTNKELNEAIKPWDIESQSRQKALLLPKAVLATLPKQQRDQLTRQQHWRDPKTVDEAIALFKLRPKDLSTAVWNQLVSGAMTYAVTSENPLIAYFRGQISNIVAEQSQISKNVIQPLGEAYEKLSKDEKIQVTKLLVMGDRQEIAFTELYLKRLGLNDNQISYFTQVRAAADYDHKLWNEKRAELGMKPVPYRKGYLPSIFEGDYKAIVKMPQLQQSGEVVDSVIGVISAFSMNSFLSIRAQIEAQFPKATIEDMPKKSFVGAPVPGQLFNVFNELTKALGPTNPEVQDLQNMLQEFAKFDEARYLGFHVHEMAKKGVWGAAGEQFWKPDLENADDLHSALVRFLEEGNAHHHSLKMMQDMDRLMLDPALQPGGEAAAPRTLQYLRELYFHVLRHHPKTGADYSRGARMFKNIGQAGDNIIELALTASDGLTAGNKSLGFGGDKLHGASGFVRHAFATWAMGLFNIPFSLMQLLQVPMFAPQMAMITRKELGMDFTTGRASAMKAALSVTQYITAHAMGGPTTKRGQMVQAILGNHEKDPEMKVAWQYAEDNNLVNFTDIERTLDKTLNPKAAKIDRVLNMNQRYAEAMTRPMVFMWMFNLERAAGVPIKEALEIAKNKTQFVMVPYDSRDRPMMYASMGFYGQALGQLKTFMHSSITQQYYYFKVAKTKKMILPAAYTALIGILFQGQMGILGMQDIDNLTRAWNQSINGKNQGIKEVLADNVPIAVERGLLSDWSGVDFYSRLRSPGVIQWPLTNSLVPSSYNWAIDRTKNVLNGLDALTKVDLEKLEKATEFQKNLNQLVPPQFKWALEERYAGPNGEVQVYPKYGPPVDGYKRDDTDRILRRLGVRSTKEALFSEQHFDSMSDKFIYNEKKKEAGLKLREAYTKGYFTGKHVEELEEKFLAAGGTMKEMKQLMKGSMAPETVEDLYFGKPSKNRAPTLIDLYELRDNRKRE